MGEVIKVIEILNKSHEIEQFKCDLDSLDYYIRNDAVKDTEDGVAISKVIIGNKGSIIGYYTLVSSAIIEDSHRNIIYSPAIELKMFAINEEFKGKKYPDIRFANMNYSDIVLWKVIEDIENIRKNHVGVKYAVLYSVKHAVALYENNGFERFEEYMAKSQDNFINGCVPMYLTF